jgi:hypothetical protein
MHGGAADETGLFIPAAPADATRLTASGLAIPDQVWAARALGLRPVREHGTAHRELVDVYLVAGQYLRPALAERGLAYEPQAWIAALLGLHTPEQYLCALAALNHAAGSPESIEPWRRRYVAHLAEDLARRVNAAVDATDGSTRHSFLARHVVLRATRLTLVTVPDSAPAQSVAAALELVDGMDVETAAMLLTHLAGDQLGRQRRDNEPTLGSYPVSLSMELIANNLFYRHGDVGTLLARTRLLWNDYGNQLERVTLRCPPSELLAEAAGFDLDELSALAFAYYAHVLDHGPDKPIRMDAFRGIAIDRSRVEAFLSRFASTPQELGAALRRCPGAWQMMPLQDRPLLRLGGDVVVLDEHYLLERVTRGLYWLVHDHERDHHGDRARHLWTQAYAEMVEARVEDQLRALAPRVLGTGKPTFFTEEDLQKAFSTRKQTASGVDAGIDFGGTTVLAEVVSASVSVPTRENADPDAFRRDMERIVLKKARQLATTAGNLLADPQPADSPLPAPARAILPVIICGGQFGPNVVISAYVAEQVAAQNLFPDPRIRPLRLVDLDELDTCAALAQQQHRTLEEILTSWLESDLRDESLQTHLVLSGAAPSEHNGAVSEALGDLFRVVGEHLGIDLDSTAE